MSYILTREPQEGDVIKLVRDQKDKPDHYVVYECPGCKRKHHVPTTGEKAWKWNKDMVRPTLGPSIRDASVPKLTTLCHHFLKEGVVCFCGDDPNVPGQKIPLKPLSDYELDEDVE